MKTPKILIVDDEPQICTAAAMFLRGKMNCEIVAKFSGEEALQALDSADFDVLLADIRMPGVDGMTVLRHAQKRIPGIIAIVLSSLDSPEKEKRVEALGALFISKPAPLKVVQTCIERELDKKGGFEYRKQGGV